MTSKHSQAQVLISQGVFDSVKTFRDFEQKVSALGEVNTKAQGDAFEIFVEAYLATQPILQCQETWLVGDIPVEIREALNLPNDSKGTISKFRKASRSIITNAKCLTEGVDVPAVDMVVFVDPRHSKIDIAQAVGRAMRKPRNSDKKVGYIVVPIFAEDASEQSIEEAIKNENFDDVALVLNALLEQDEELAEIIRELKQSKGRGEVFNPGRFKEKIEVIGPLIGLDELTNSIYVEAVNRLGESWDEGYERLIKFKEREGHCRVPRSFLPDEFKLGGWVDRQRQNKKKLSNDRIVRLDELGFVWGDADRWEEGFNHLVNFKEIESHCRVPRSFLLYEFKLGGWVDKQRNRKDRLSNDQIQRLNDLGFSWDPLDDLWEEGFSLLVKFKESESHCRVPVTHKHLEQQALLQLLYHWFLWLDVLKAKIFYH